jgi:hypothetical protein
MNQNITITNIHPRGFAFAISDEGDQVFIPPHIANASPLKIGDKLMSQLVINPNEIERRNTKFLAVVLNSVAEAPAKDTPVGTAALDATTYDLICENAYTTTAELADYLDVDTKTAGNSAYRLFNSGKIAKADVYARVGQSRPSFILWAKNAADFLEG